jgi:uncharacterized protein involved in exopolysaccharide biosynthesis
MGSKKNKGYSFDSLNIIAYLIRRWRFLAGFTLLAMIVSVIVALTIPVKFKSTVVFFPAASVSVSQALLSANFSGSQGGITSFGDEEEAEQLLQVLNSEKIRERIIEKHNLTSHYGLDSSNRYLRTAMRNIFRENIKFRRTEFSSLEISVMDQDRELAAVIANDIAALLDSTLNSMRRRRAVKALEIVNREWENVQTKIREVDDSMAIYRRMGMAGYENQVEVLTDNYGQALVKGNMSAARTIEQRLKFLGEYGTQYVTLRANLDMYLRQQIELRSKQAQARVDAEQELPNTFIVDNAIPADKKSYPVRWLVVAVSTMAAFLFALLAALIFDNWDSITG